MITYQEEKLANILDELKPLLEDHYQEVAIYKDHIALNPAYDLYLAMEVAGSLHVFTARDTTAQELIGYCITFVHKSPHYQDHVYAVNDVIFVKEEYRHSEIAPNMLNQLELIMEQTGVSVMTFHMKTYKPFETLMDILGYDKIEYLYSKYIGA